MVKLTLSDLRKLVKETIEAQDLKDNKRDDQDREDVREFDYTTEALKIIDKWGLDPDLIGWKKIVHTHAVANKGILKNVDEQKLVDEIEKLVKERVADLDKFLAKRGTK